MTPVILVDLDGCLKQMVGHSLAHHGRTIHPRDFGDDVVVQAGLADNPAAFWNPLGREFTASIPWTDEGKALIEGINKIKGVLVGILSSPWNTPGCRDGKQDWVTREIPDLKSHVLLGRTKYLVASPKHLLVDDNEDQVRAFRFHDGHAVLVPRPWNSRKNELDSDGRFDVPNVLAEIHAAVENIHTLTAKWRE